jgi:hypothetical protein
MSSDRKVLEFDKPVWTDRIVIRIKACFGTAIDSYCAMRVGLMALQNN